MRYTRATAEEKQAYSAQTPRPCYPLAGWVRIDGHRCAVERCANFGSRDDPTLEVICPKGMHIAWEELHTVLCDSIKDISERLDGAELVPCTENCG